ncbi:MAG: TPM domain-containing protein [Acidimicrobiia bacterium]|nr:TPM domain-containing protein [Acidimicrobiia bacterium]
MARRAQVTPPMARTGNVARVARGALSLLRIGVALVLLAASVSAQDLPALAGPVNDFADIVDPASREAIDSVSRSLLQASGDVVVVATLQTIEPFGDIRELAVELFENHGRGIGARGRDNGLLVVLAVDERQVWVEVGYDLESIVTDGFAGETSRQFMVPEFREGRYGTGLLAGVVRIAARIAERRGVTLQGVPAARQPDVQPESDIGGALLITILIFFAVFSILGSRFGGGRRRGLRRGGWTSGVGPFGGGVGRHGGWGGGVGGGFGGGFGGFGGGRSGGGGGGASW